MNPWFTLSFAIVAEVIGTSTLKATEGFTRLWPALVVVLGYGLSFYCLSLTLRTLPVGVVYAIWCGVGIALVALIGWIAYSQKLDVAALAGIALILAGVAVIQLFSKASGH